MRISAVRYTDYWRTDARFPALKCWAIFNRPLRGHSFGDNMKSNRIPNLSIALLLFVSSALFSFAQPAQMTQQRELADYIKSHYTKSEVMIPMRDGVKLFVCIYEPKYKKQKYA